jgi:zinc/manganese transport system substrate-binding protein
MPSKTRIMATAVAALSLLVGPARAVDNKQLFVVATLPTYGAIARTIAGDRADVRVLAKGSEDPHFVRPKPSLALTVKKADLLISTGLDLELWLPPVLDKAGNPKVRSGQAGFVSASQGIQLLEKPAVLSRSEGGVHIYGNPHVYTGPLNGKIIARNILVGLKRVDPAGSAIYTKNYRVFLDRIDEHLFGKPLLKILGARVLTKLALSGKLVPFLEGRQFRGKPLLSYLGGWMRRALPLRGRRIVAYHKNWIYFTQVFGLQIVEYVEPKPGVPPSPGHVAKVIDTMRQQKVKVILAANYYDTAKVKSIADRVGGEPAIKGFCCQFDVWIDRLVDAFAKVGK